MMYCDRCNIDFADGLRYCKWCGQTLIERRRDTSELQSCPACSAAIKQEWAFCKSCGEPLDGSPRETASASCPRCNATTDLASRNCSRCGLDLTNGRESGHISNTGVIQTSVISNCPSCGEGIESASIYCKACGSALYAEQTPFGSSALLCSVCHSYSPLGSTTCRVCGALLIETEADLSAQASDTLLIDQQKSSTLPDLADHLPDTELVNLPVVSEAQPPEPSDGEVESGAHTLVFTDSDSAQLGSPAADPDAARSAAPGKATSLLPGVSGSQFEQPTPTTVFKQTRTTAPVESESAEESPSKDSHDDSSEVYNHLVTRVGTESFFASEEQEPHAAEGTSVLGSGAELSESGSQLPGRGTVVFGSDLTKREDELAANRWDAERPVDGQQMMTAPFGIVPPPAADREEAISTRVMQGPQATDVAAAQEARAADQPAEPSYRTNKEIPVVKVDSQVATARPAAEKKKNSAALISIAALIVLALALSAAWYFLSGRRGPVPQAQEPPVADSQPAAPPQPPAVPQPTADKPPAPSAPEGMALVAGGAYVIGRDDGDPLERPRHTVELPGFFIDRTEVTNADYKKFIDATGHTPPPNWKNGSYPEGKGNYPVTSVTWDDATQYATWAGKRLPTEAEWEAAARGADGRLYPWGDQWQADLSNIGLKAKTLTASQYADEIKPVGEFPKGASAVGVLDLIGNVWEWTADEFALYEGGIKKLPPDFVSKIEPGKVYRVIRGGAFDGSKIHDATYRGLLDASQRYPKVGFRCVKDAAGGQR